MSGAPPSDVPPPSLAGQLAMLVRRRRRDTRSVGEEKGAVARWPAVALALLIAAGPACTIGGAQLLRAAAAGEAARLEAQAAPRRAAERGREQARHVLGAAIIRPGPAALLDQIAAVLPQDDTLTRAERAADGSLEIEVATGDPDALRSAMRRQPALAGLRDVRQREGEGRTIVLLRQAAP